MTKKEVATREGGVDRNISTPVPPYDVGVATREGGVDRNTRLISSSCSRHVATREGGVDRNNLVMSYVLRYMRRHPRGWRG